MTTPLAAAIVLLAPLLFGTGPVAAPERGPAEPADAVVLNLTEADLNRILEDAFRSNGGPVFEGRSRRLSRGISDLHYHANLSSPVLRLAGGGHASIRLDVLRASIEIGRIERKIGGRVASCENAGAVVEPDHPLDVTLALQFLIEDGRLQVRPERVLVPDAEESLRLVKPSRCTNAPLPTWLLWWIGRPHLRRHVEGLDGILLASARRTAARLNEDLNDLRWEAAPLFGDGESREMRLRPRAVASDAGSLVVAWERTGAAPPTDHRAAGPAPRADRSYVAASESFLNDAIAAFFGGSAEPRRPGGQFSKLFGSAAIYALVPGLREAGSREDLAITIAFPVPPRLELARLKPADREGRARPLLRLRISDASLDLWERGEVDDRLLGTLRIDEATVGVSPVVGPLGGISLEIEENEWRVSSSGIEFDDHLLAATLQELVFAEAFETGYAPLLRGALRVGETEMVPANVVVEGSFLVIELAAR